MKKANLLIASPILMLTLFIVGQAQTEISEEKRKLIAEIITVTKVDKQIIQVTDILLKSMESTYPTGFAQAIDSRKDLSLSQKDMLKAKSTESFKAFSQKFRERLPQAVDYNKYIQETMYPLYDKFFQPRNCKI